jgi:hypothetical protein
MSVKERVGGSHFEKKPVIVTAKVGGEKKKSGDECWGSVARPSDACLRCTKPGGQLDMPLPRLISADKDDRRGHDSLPQNRLSIEFLTEQNAISRIAP